MSLVSGLVVSSMDTWIIGDFTTGQAIWSVAHPGDSSSWEATIAGGTATLSLTPQIPFQRDLALELSSHLGFQYYAAVLNEQNYIEVAGPIMSCKRTPAEWSFAIGSATDYLSHRVAVNERDQNPTQVDQGRIYTLKGTWQQITATALAYLRRHDYPDPPISFATQHTDEKKTTFKIETLNLNTLDSVLSDIAQQASTELAILPEGRGVWPLGRVQWKVTLGTKEFPIVVPTKDAWPFDVGAPQSSRAILSWDIDGTTQATHVWTSGSTTGREGKPFAVVVKNAGRLPSGMPQVDLVDSSSGIDHRPIARWHATTLGRANAAPTHTCEVNITPDGLPDPDLVRAGDLVDLVGTRNHPLVPDGVHHMRVMKKTRGKDGLTALSLTELSPILASTYRDYFH